MMADEPAEEGLHSGGADSPGDGDPVRHAVGGDVESLDCQGIPTNAPRAPLERRVAIVA